jgi:hypothetical protein
MCRPQGAERSLYSSWFFAEAIFDFGASLNSAHQPTGLTRLCRGCESPMLHNWLDSMRSKALKAHTPRNEDDEKERKEARRRKERGLVPM